MKKTLSRILTGINIVIVAVLAVHVVRMAVYGFRGEIPFTGGYAIITLKTNSMASEMPKGTYLLVCRVTDPETLVPGDVITFYSSDPMISGMLNTHRVVSVDLEKRQIITKGDNNPVADETPAEFNSVCARAVRVLPVLTACVGFLGDHMKIILLALISAMLSLYIAFLLLRIIIHRKRMNRLVEEEIKRLQENGYPGDLPDDVKENGNVSETEMEDRVQEAEKEDRGAGEETLPFSGGTGGSDSDA